MCVCLCVSVSVCVCVCVYNVYNIYIYIYVGGHQRALKVVLQVKAAPSERAGHDLCVRGHRCAVGGGG